jgi:hypothetical protein
MEGFQTSILVSFHELFTFLHPQCHNFLHLFIIAIYTNLILVEWTGAEGSIVPTILLASISLVCVELAEIPWYSWISGSNTSENTCNRGHSQPEPEFLNPLRSPGICSKEPIPPAFVALRAGTITLLHLGSYSQHRLL